MVSSYGISDAEIDQTYRTSLIMPPGERVALFFHRLEEACEIVSDLLKDGIRQRELCVLVFREPEALIKEMMRCRGLDLDIERSVVLVPQKEFALDNFTQAILEESMRGLAQRAKVLGFVGARLILNVPEEMSAQLPTEGAWSELERTREELGLTMVCLFNMTVLSPGFLLRSLSYYPRVIIDGTLCRNFYHMPVIAVTRPENYQGFYEQLESIREERDIRENEHRERSMLREMNRELQDELTQRQMVEFALLRVENNMRTMLDAMPDMVIMLDRDLRVTMGNHAFIRYLQDMGLDTYFEGTSIYDLLPGTSTKGRRLIEEVFQYGHPTVIETSVPTDIGNLDMEVRLVPITVDGKVDRLVAIARPWTPPSRDLRGMWGRFDSLRQEVLDPAGPMAGSMESCPHPALLVIHGGQLLKVNQALANELGRSMDEIMAMGNAFSFLAPFKGKDGIARRTNIEGRITIPSVLTRRDGSTQKVICYLMYVGEGDDHRVLVVISKEQ